MQRLLQTGVSKFEVALLYIATALFMLPVGVQAASDGISVKLAPYIVGYIGSFPVTATMITVWVSMALLVLFAVIVKSSLRPVPGKLQVFAETMVGGAYDYVAETLESKQLANKYFPIIFTIFIFLLVMNWVGLLPGVTSVGLESGDKFTPILYPPATDLNIALAFALIALFTIEFAGIAALGVFKYGGKFINFSSPLKFVIGIIELISELARIISFTFRLFGNIFAGKMLLTVAFFFIPVWLPLPMLVMGYELFVGLIQAVVFAFLTLLFVKLAVEEPH